jgi:hypothetical protein
MAGFLSNLWGNVTGQNAANAAMDAARISSQGYTQAGNLVNDAYLKSGNLQSDTFNRVGQNLSDVYNRVGAQNRDAYNQYGTAAGQAYGAQGANLTGLGQQYQQQQGALAGQFAPYTAAGANATNLQADLSGANGPDAQARAYAQYQASPGVEWATQQGLRGVNNSAAANRMGNSGPALKALSNYSQNMAQQDFGNWYSRLGQLGSLGLQATNAGAGYQSLGNRGLLDASVLGSNAYLNADLMPAQAGLAGSQAYGLGQTQGATALGQGQTQGATALGQGMTGGATALGNATTGAANATAQGMTDAAKAQQQAFQNLLNLGGSLAGTAMGNPGSLANLAKPVTSLFGGYNLNMNAPTSSPSSSFLPIPSFY